MISRRNSNSILYANDISSDNSDEPSVLFGIVSVGNTCLRNEFLIKPSLFAHFYQYLNSSFQLINKFWLSLFLLVFPYELNSFSLIKTCVLKYNIIIFFFFLHRLSGSHMLMSELKDLSTCKKVSERKEGKKMSFGPAFSSMDGTFRTDVHKKKLSPQLSLIFISPSVLFCCSTSQSGCWSLDTVTCSPHLLLQLSISAVILTLISLSSNNFPSSFACAVFAIVQQWSALGTYQLLSLSSPVIQFLACCHRQGSISYNVHICWLCCFIFHIYTATVCHD